MKMKQEKVLIIFGATREYRNKDEDTKQCKALMDENCSFNELKG